MKRVTIYARVSTKEQNLDMQIIEPRANAQVRGLGIVHEYIAMLVAVRTIGRII